MNDRKKCDVSYSAYYSEFPEDTKDNCIFLIPEQFGGDETNRSTFCLLRGFDYPECGCIFRKTKDELMSVMRKEI